MMNTPSQATYDYCYFIGFDFFFVYYCGTKRDQPFHALDRSDEIYDLDHDLQ